MKLENAKSAKHQIRRIKGIGVLGSFDYLIDYSATDTSLYPIDDTVRLVYAENGTGKTTFLRALSRLLDPDPDSLNAIWEMPVQSVRVETDQERVISFEKRENGLALLARTKEEIVAESFIPEESFDQRAPGKVFERYSGFKEFVNEVNSNFPAVVFIGDDRGIHSYGTEVSNPMDRDIRLHSRGFERPRSRRPHRGRVNLVESLDAVNEIFRSAAFLQSSVKGGHATDPYLVIAKSILQGNEHVLSASESREELEDKVAKLTRLVIEFEQMGLYDMRELRAINKLIKGARANSAHFKTLYIALAPHLDNEIRKAESIKPVFDLINAFVTSVNSFLTRKTIEFRVGRGLNLVKNEEVLDPIALSSGEKHLLVLLSQAVIASNQGGFLILDEPEISLGLDWQRRLLEEMVACTKADPVQILVASHSLQLIAGVEDVVEPVER